MSEESNDELARKQVDAFMVHLADRLQIDEESLKKVVFSQKRNGRFYVTWAVALSVAFALISWLVNDKMNAMSDERVRIQSQVARIMELQNDVRERLRALEQVVYRSDHK